MRELKMGELENTLRDVCARVGDVYIGDYRIKDCKIGKDAKHAKHDRIEVFFWGRNAEYQALFRNMETKVWRVSNRTQLALLSDITSADFVQERPEHPFLTSRQVERLTKILYDEHADPLRLVKRCEDPKELHVLAANWNLDDFRTAQLMRAIIHHPMCDRGTAMMIYWDSGGIFCDYSNRSEVEEWATEIYDLVLEIEERISTNGFRSQTIAFYPSAVNILLRNAKRQIPTIMREPTQGEPLTNLLI